MAKAPIGYTGNLVYDEAFHYQTGQGEFGSSAVTDLGAFIAPCDMTLKELYFRSTDTLTADATVDLGIQGNDDALIAAYPVDGAAQLIEVSLDTDDTEIVSLTVNKGDYVYFTLNADADGNAGDQLAFTAVWVPTASEG
jgi:hypothetical protein